MIAEPVVVNRPDEEKTGGSNGKRRRRSKLERRRIVEETLVAGASVARVARAHGVNANQVFQWRRLYKRGLLGADGTAPGLLPVKITGDAPPGTGQAGQVTGQADSGQPSAGTIHLALRKAHLRIEGSADPTTLRTVLECLLR